MSQLYNADETGIYWCAQPSNTQAFCAEAHTPGHKVSKDHVSAMVCANADGTHRLKLAVVGKATKPRSLKNVMDSLSVHYYLNKAVWFDHDIVSKWFHTCCVPEIVSYQVNELKIAQENVKGLVLLDNAPCHPSTEHLSSADGKIKCIFCHLIPPR